MKRFLKVIAVLVIIWIAVTGYFITQHTVESKEAKLNQTIVFDDLTLNIDSIVFYNFKRERPDYTISEFKYNLVSRLPEILVRPYLRINPHEHIAIVSDKRRKDGVPYILHNAGPTPSETDQLQSWPSKITGHFRFPKF